ncbi:MAG: hypothetical protein LBC99_07060 [Spirochaetota bacterium]|jgi:hypothetical protein|nr:hypothetical protein [Spirochaetota bacterium]
MLDDKIISEAVNSGKISVRLLKGLRTLTTCNNWAKVIPLGIIDYATTITNYKGMLVELDKHVYFLRQETADALREPLKWKVTKVIKVE